MIGEPTLRFAKGFLDTGAELGTIVFFALLLLLGGSEWFDGFLEVVPSGSRALWRRLGDGVTKAVGGYVLGNLLISVIAGTVATVVLLATRVPYALPLGLVVAVFDLIPMVGATLATVIVALVALHQGIGTCAVVVSALVIYQLVENQFLTPAVYHGTVKLSLITIAVSLAIGAELGGAAGALMAIPIAGAIRVGLTEVLAWRRGSSTRFAS
jgi:predicted PurR-regulated permease PerM